MKQVERYPMILKKTWISSSFLMSLFQSGTIYLQKTNFDELFFKLYLINEV